MAQRVPIRWHWVERSASLQPCQLGFELCHPLTQLVQLTAHIVIHGHHARSPLSGALVEQLKPERSARQSGHGAEPRTCGRATGYFERVTNSSDLVAVMAELHAALAPGDLAQTLRRVTDAAVELLPDVDGATITVEYADGRFETAAATGSADARSGAGRKAWARRHPSWPRRPRHGLTACSGPLDEGPAVDVTDSSGTIRRVRCRR